MKYIELWRTANRHLQAYVTSRETNESPDIYVSDHTHRTYDIADEESKEDTCTESIIRMISSSDKADQMKARREKTLVIVKNPMMKS